MVRAHADAPLCSPEWATGNLEDKITWDYGSQDGVAYHTFQRQDQKEISEQKDMADWGTFYWSTADGKGVSHPIRHVNYQIRHSGWRS